MGGDRGPDEIVAGALEAASDDIVPVIVGAPGLDPHGLEHEPAAEVIGMDEKPAEAVRSKPDSSLVASCRIVAEGRADAVVSPGNTGAMLAAGLLTLRRIPGALRRPLAVPVPPRARPAGPRHCGAPPPARRGHPPPLP